MAGQEPSFRDGLTAQRSHARRKTRLCPCSTLLQHCFQSAAHKIHKTANMEDIKYRREQLSAELTVVTGWCSPGGLKLT